MESIVRAGMNQAQEDSKNVTASAAQVPEGLQGQLVEAVRQGLAQLLPEVAQLLQKQEQRLLKVLGPDRRPRHPILPGSPTGTGCLPAPAQRHCPGSCGSTSAEKLKPGSHAKAPAKRHTRVSTWTGGQTFNLGWTRKLMEHVGVTAHAVPRDMKDLEDERDSELLAAVPRPPAPHLTNAAPSIHAGSSTDKDTVSTHDRGTPEDLPRHGCRNVKLGKVAKEVPVAAPPPVQPNVPGSIPAELPDILVQTQHWPGQCSPCDKTPEQSPGCRDSCQSSAQVFVGPTLSDPAKPKRGSQVGTSARNLDPRKFASDPLVPPGLDCKKQGGKNASTGDGRWLSSSRNQSASSTIKSSNPEGRQCPSSQYRGSNSEWDWLATLRLDYAKTKPFDMKSVEDVIDSELLSHRHFRGHQGMRDSSVEDCLLPPTCSSISEKLSDLEHLMDMACWPEEPAAATALDATAAPHSTFEGSINRSVSMQPMHHPQVAVELQEPNTDGGLGNRHAWSFPPYQCYPGQRPQPQHGERGWAASASWARKDSCGSSDIHAVRLKQEEELLSEFGSESSGCKEGYDPSPGASGVRRVGSPVLLRLCGVLPWGRLGAAYRCGMLLLPVCSVAIFTQQLYQAQSHRVSNVGCLAGVCLHFTCLNDLVLALGSFLGLLAMRTVHSRRLLGSPATLLVRYAVKRNAVHRWASASSWQALCLTSVWAGSLACRAVAIAREPDLSGWQAAVNACAFALTSLIFMGLAFGILHVSSLICILIDSYVLRVKETLDPAWCIQEWDKLGALLRKASRAVERGFLMVQFAALGMLLCSFSGLLLQGGRQVWWFGSNALLAQSLVLVLSKAAEVTEMCKRLPPLINAMDFEADNFSQARHYLVEHITYSAAGFHILEIRLTAVMALKLFYISILATFGILTKLSTA